jgi:hypothetical protein
MVNGGPGVTSISIDQARAQTFYSEVFGGRCRWQKHLRRPDNGTGCGVRLFRYCKKLACQPVLGYRLHLKFAPARRTPIHNINEAPRYI